MQFIQICLNVKFQLTLAISKCVCNQWNFNTFASCSKIGREQGHHTDSQLFLFFRPDQDQNRDSNLSLFLVSEWGHNSTDASIVSNVSQLVSLRAYQLVSLLAYALYQLTCLLVYMPTSVLACLLICLLDSQFTSCVRMQNSLLLRMFQNVFIVNGILMLSYSAAKSCENTARLHKVNCIYSSALMQVRIGTVNYCYSLGLTVLAQQWRQ